ncbi:glycoside hydrolase family 35 protein [Cohnella soli]|uniref:Beta-galactosidase family protein n=1 Tax=Cohnella soli TaxID=425005 RepID=A0ABW0HYG4_9BACL
MSVFGIEGNKFVHDGKSVQLISGALHYFRVVPEYWRDRLLKLKACGLNCVETYVPWNLHEPEPGLFDFSGMTDVTRFVESAGELGLYVIIRPSPYICAEWEFGGLPAWLLRDEGMRLRCSHRPFLDRVDTYYDELIPRLLPYQCTRGGPIIAMQIENEYGSYGNDKDYLEYLKDGLTNRGVDVLLFTSDGYTDANLQGGMLPGVFETVNFGSRPEEAFAKLLEYQPDKPLMCMEYWNGWFDHWNKPHHTRDSQDAAAVLDEMLAMGASVNLYMFHGGTNFGFYNGANCLEKYEATTTSYDYDAALTEAGDYTEKYTAFRAVIEKYAGPIDTEMPPSTPKKAYGKVALTESVRLFDSLGELSAPVRRPCPDPMEKVGQNYGFILYESRISGPQDDCEISLQDVHDRALVFIDDRYLGVIDRWSKQKLACSIPSGGAKLSILVENMGRINYGPFHKDFKGITEAVKIGIAMLHDWTIYPLPLSDLSGLSFERLEKLDPGVPAFYRGTFHAEEIADTYLSMEGWGKGVAYVNGFNLGRYWEAGPQKTLYIPAPLLRQGDNEIVLFELHGADAPEVTLVDRPFIQ